MARSYTSAEWNIHGRSASGLVITEKSMKEFQTIHKDKREEHRHEHN